MPFNWYNKNSKKSPGAKLNTGGGKGNKQLKYSNNAVQQGEIKDVTSNVHLTATQLSQLLKLLPQSSKEHEIDDEFESFS